jgi:RNA polymerase sigma-70 factor (ECF subfamily)
MIAVWPPRTPMRGFVVQASTPASLVSWLCWALCSSQKDVLIERSPSEDAQDLRAAAAGNGDAYARIVRLHQPCIAKRMFRFTRDPAMAEELTHDVFVEAYFSLKHYRGDAPFEHWLQRIATRVGYRFWKQERRNRKRRNLLETHARETAPPPCRPAVDSTEGLDRIMDQLPPRDRLVITLLYLDEKTVEETARLTGWSKVMVKVQAHRARAKLRRLMETADE